MKGHFRPRWLMLALAVVILAAGGGVAYATASHSTDSTIHVEKVVYEPTAAVPARSEACWLSARPLSTPSTSAPLRFTTRVP